MTEKLLRLTFGLEAPIRAIHAAPEGEDMNEGQIFEFIVGNEEPPHALLRGDGEAYTTPEGDRYYRMRYEVLA